MRFVRHPFFERDLIGIVDHIVDVTDGDVAAARRRLDEVDDLIQKIAASPKSGGMAQRQAGRMAHAPWRRRSPTDHRIQAEFRCRANLSRSRRIRRPGLNEARVGKTAVRRLISKPATRKTSKT